MDMPLMLNIQLAWTFQSFPTPKSTQLEIMFWQLDVVQVDLFVASDFHLLLISKKEESLKELLSIHFYLFRKGLHVTKWSILKFKMALSESGPWNPNLGRFEGRLLPTSRLKILFRKTRGYDFGERRTVEK